MKKMIVGQLDAGQRLDKYLGRRMGLAPVSFFYKMLRKKNITLNGKKATGKELLSEGDEVSLFLSDETIEKFMVKEEKSGKKLDEVKETIPPVEKKRIVFETRDFLLYNKPSGTLTQKAHKDDISLNEQLLAYCRSQEEQSTGFCPSVANRLDRNTSGLVTFGKTLPGSRMLTEMFRERTGKKIYLAVVKGKVTEFNRQRAWLKKEENRNQVTVRLRPFPGAEEIETAYMPVGYNGTNTLLEVLLITGKTHQIRAFLSFIGHPIVGDGKYGSGGSGQLLHSWCLVFPNLKEEPFVSLSGREFYAEVPEKLEKAILPVEIPSVRHEVWDQVKEKKAERKQS